MMDPDDEILARVREMMTKAEARLVEMSTDEKLTQRQRQQVKRALTKWRDGTLGAEKSTKKRRRIKYN